MKVTEKGNDVIVEYQSIQEFVDYCLHTPQNETFKYDSDCSSKKESNEKTRFTGTKSLDEALDLMKNGWGEGSEKLSHIFKEKVKATEIGKVRRSVIGVQGYQPIVPLYLSNQPENMVSTVMKPIKQKIVTLDKDISYNAAFTSGQIMEYSARALKVIHNFESNGYRCNLNVVLGTGVGYSRRITYYVKVKIKSANERFNISKMSFPLAHTSMLRRLYFRWIEVYPGVPSDFRYGYGSPASQSELQEVWKDDYILPRIISDNLEKARNIDELNEGIKKRW